MSDNTKNIHSISWNITENILPALNLPAIWFNDDTGKREVYKENDHAIVLGYNEELGIFKAKLDAYGRWSEISSSSSNGTGKAIPTHWMNMPRTPNEIEDIAKVPEKLSMSIVADVLDNNINSNEFVRGLSDDFEMASDITKKFLDDSSHLNLNQRSRIGLKQRLIKAICDHIRTFIN